MKEFDALIAVVERLRRECPWDKEQTLTSLRPYLLEETYEVLEAMDALSAQDSANEPTPIASPDAVNNVVNNPLDDPLDNLLEEWGDLLLQIVLQAIIVRESRPSLSFEAILDRLREKLIRRHPHVFNETPLESTSQVLTQWDRLKAEEKRQKSLQNSATSPSQAKSLLDGIQPKAPALLYALKIGDRSRKIQFDWSTSDDVWKQVLSELAELDAERDGRSSHSASDYSDASKGCAARRKEEELGDLLFTLVQWARHEALNPEAALAAANQKFIRRFSTMERLMDERGLIWTKLSLEEKESLWSEAKTLLGAAKN